MTQQTLFLAGLGVFLAGFVLGHGIGKPAPTPPDKIVVECRCPTKAQCDKAIESIRHVEWRVK